MRVWLGLLVCLLLAVCAEGDSTTIDPPVVPGPDAAVDAAAADGGDAGPWTDLQKCEHMCQAYCEKKLMCDGSPPVSQCRMTIDERNGGTCEKRAQLFDPVSQERVEACIRAIQALSCPAFEDVYLYGKGVPEPCKGILS